MFGSWNTCYTVFVLKFDNVTFLQSNGPNSSGVTNVLNYLNMIILMVYFIYDIESYGDENL